MNKMMKSSGFVGIALALIVMSGCFDTTSPSPSGSLTGHVQVLNADGSYSAFSGVTVAIVGTNNTAQTDSTGRWTISNLKEGSYNLSYTKSGFGQTQTNEVQFIGGAIRDLGQVSLCAAPNYTVSSLRDRFYKGMDSTAVYLAVSLSDTSVRAPYRTVLFFGRDSSVNWNVSNNVGYSVQSTYFKSGVDSTSIKLSSDAFAAYGLVHGDTVYIAAYVANAGTNNSGWTDLTTDRYVFTNIDTTSRFVIPIVLP